MPTVVYIESLGELADGAKVRLLIVALSVNYRGGADTSFLGQFLLGEKTPGACLS